MNWGPNLNYLAEQLAVLDAKTKNSTNLVLETMLIPNKYGEWQRVKTLENLILGGAILPTNTVMKLFEMTLEYLQSNGSYLNENQRSLLIDFLCLLAFVDNPPKGLEKIQKTISKFDFRNYELQKLITAIGHSRCDNAVSFLYELARAKGQHLEHMSKSWVEAVANLETSQSRRLLLSFIDPNIKEYKTGAMDLRHDVLTSHIASLVRLHPDIKKRILQFCELKLSIKKRELLSEIIASLGTTEFILAGLNLIDDNANPPIPNSIFQSIEDIFVEHRPHGPSDNFYTLVARSSNAIRTKLFYMATHDRNRKRSAFKLLGNLERWRLEYGKPHDEPRHPNFDSRTSWPFLSESIQ